MQAYSQPFHAQWYCGMQYGPYFQSGLLQICRYLFAAGIIAHNQGLNRAAAIFPAGAACFVYPVPEVRDQFMQWLICKTGGG